MGTLREELEQKLRELPECPFFAQLLDPAHLSARQLAQAPYLRSTRLFVVSEVALDRCFEQPGLWVKTIASQPVFKPGECIIINEWEHIYTPGPPATFKGSSIWLNLDWCKVYDRPDASLNLKVN